MIRVFHISDLHIDNTTQYDWEQYTKKALIETIKSQLPQCPVKDTFVICSGDMINKAGETLGGVKAALCHFKEKVIQPILDGTGLPLSHFIILPGNHEVNRRADDDIQVEGLRTIIARDGAGRINDYTQLLNGDYRASNRIKEYNEFVAELYQGIDNIQISLLGTTFTFETSDGKLGIAAFNTVWNCYDNNDIDRGLAIGEPSTNSVGRIWKGVTSRLLPCTIRLSA